jgi:hypothetical protein
MDISRGLDAYAHRQADIYRSLAISFVKLWSPELRENSITVEWPSELAELAATVDALPVRKSGRKAKYAQVSDSESEGGAAGSIQFSGSDTESLVGGENLVGSDGENILQHLVGYVDSEEDDS